MQQLPPILLSLSCSSGKMALTRTILRFILFRKRTVIAASEMCVKISIEYLDSIGLLRDAVLTCVFGTQTHESPLQDLC